MTDHCTGNTQAFEFLAVIRARLGAVVRHEDNLLSCGNYQLLLFVDRDIDSYHCFAEVPMSPLFQGRGSHLTIVRLYHSCLSCCCCDAAKSLRGDGMWGEKRDREGKQTIAVEEEYLNMTLSVKAAILGLQCDQERELTSNLARNSWRPALSPVK